MLWSLLHPSGLLVGCAVAGLLLGFTSWRRLGRGLSVAGVGGLALTLLLPVDRWALRPLEDRFPRPDLPARIDGIVMLGGAIETLVSVDRGIPSLNGAAERFTEFVALARRYPHAKLAFTGGNGDLLPGSEPEAVAAEELLTALGVPPERMVFEAASRTTWDNAVYSYEMLHPAAGETWLLITSASHMPRAVGAFRAAGWQALPWPVGYKTLHHGLELALPVSLGERLSNLDWAAHEWVGLAAYRLLGRSSAWFPGPG